MSADGTKQTALAYGGTIYVSTDSGQTWTAKGTTKDWFYNAMSSTGSMQLAATNDEYLYISSPVAPAASGFNGTDFGSEPDLTNVTHMVLSKPETAVRWNGSVDVDGQDLASNVLMGDRFVSLNMAALDPSMNSSAVINMSDMHCAQFELYYAVGFYNNSGSIRSAGRLVATAANLGGSCTDASVCTNLQCSNGVLTFTAKHFDGFGGGDPLPITPEFGTWAMILALALAIGGFAYVRKR
jgi:hypothetical protein